MVELPRKEEFESTDPGINGDDPAATPAEQVASTPVAAPRRKSAVKKGVLALVLLAGGAYGVHFGHHYWTVGRFIESTDNAYVKADYTTVAPKVAGYVKEVLVNDNDTVTARAGSCADRRS